MNTNRIVKIVSHEEKCIGTGFFVSQDGHILTCSHVLKQAGYTGKRKETIAYKLSDDECIQKAILISNITKEDIALLQAIEKKPESYYMFSSYRAEEQKVDVFGYPNKEGIGLKASAIYEHFNMAKQWIQLGKANNISNGFSGAPVVFKDTVLGMVHSITKQDEQGRLSEVAFAISSDRITKFFPELLETVGLCPGYKDREKICTNYSLEKKGGFCKICYTEQFKDSIISFYKAQQYQITKICDNYFTVSLKYGLSEYTDIIFIALKFNGETLSYDDFEKMKKEASYEIDSSTKIIVITNVDLKEETISKDYLKQSNIKVYSEDDLMRSIFNYENYLLDLGKYVNCEPLAHHFIDVYAEKHWRQRKNDFLPKSFEDTYFEDEDLISNNILEEYEEWSYNEVDFDDMPANIVQTKELMKEYVDSFLLSDHNALLILGDYGCGKTSFCYKYAYDLLQKYINKEETFFPIVVKLRSYNKAVGVTQILTDYFVNDLGMSNFNIETFNIIRKKLNILLIFDGYDEVAKKVDFDIKYDVLKEICKYCSYNTKIIVSCRPNFFQSTKEFEKIFKKSPYAFEPGENMHIDFLENSITELNAEQVEAYINSYDKELQMQGISVDEMLETITHTHDLQDLAKRPFLLYMMWKTLPHIIKDVKGKGIRNINAAKLYAEYTDVWIKREENKNKTLIKQEEKELFCKELAMELYIANESSISYRELPQRIKAHFKNIDDFDEINYFSHDIQSCSFLTSNRSDEFMFIHRSFMEYFVAAMIYQNINKLVIKRQIKGEELEAVLAITPLSMEICFFINDMLENNVIAWRNFFVKYISGVSYKARYNLLAIISKSNLDISSVLKALSTNNKCKLEKTDLSHAIIENETLRKMDFGESSFYMARIKMVKFINCCFDRTFFNKTTLSDVEFVNCSFQRSVWKDVNMNGCVFDRYSFTDCSIQDSTFANTSFTDIDFTGTRIWGDNTFMLNSYNNCIGVPYQFD